MIPHIPLALVLGSDAKPAKLRVAVKCNTPNTYTVKDLWLAEHDLEILLKGGIAFHKNGLWKFSGYRWLPVVDMEDRIIQDGLVLTEDEIVFNESVFDARGKSKIYSRERLSAKAGEDESQKLFCNLDYASLPNIKRLSPMTCFRVPDDMLSIDLKNAMAMMNPHIEYDGGTIRLHNEFFQTKIAMLPDTWRVVSAMNIESSVLEGVSCPKVMNQCNLQFNNVPNLKALTLPERVSVFSALTYVEQSFTIRNNNCLEELILPAKFGSTCMIVISDCKALKSIRTCSAKQGVVTTGVAMFVVRCGNLKVIDTPHYEYCELEIGDGSELERLRCRSRSFANGRFKFGSGVNSGRCPDIIGIGG